MAKSNKITSLVLVLLLSLNVSVVSAEHTKSNLEYRRPSAHSQEVPVTDMTWTFAPGQSVGINAEAGTVYTVSDPEVISPLDGKPGWFKANKNGEALIFIHQPTLGDFVCRVIVGTADREQAENPVYYGADGSGKEEAVQDSAEVLAQEVLQLVNAERAKVGARPLRLSQDLQDAAVIRAEELTRHFSHERPDGSSCFTLLHNRNRTLGENIAAGNATPEEVVDQWMHSPGHRANILNKDFKELGVGYCRKEGTEYTHYWIQMFRG